MSNHPPGLLPIGMFSTLTGISIRMLRYYQEHELLEPAKIDTFTGRRFYQPDQLPTARIITQLRDTGMKVTTIATLINENNNPTHIHTALKTHRAELYSRRDELHQQLTALDQVTITLEGKPTMTNVSINTLPAMTTASLRKILPTYNDEGQLWQEIMPLIKEAGATFPADGIAGATFHDHEFKETDVDIEVWIQVAAPFPTTTKLACQQLPKQQVVTATLKGDYSQMSTVTEAAGRYIAKHQLTTGPMFNIYHISPTQNPDPSSWITQVCFPVVDPGE